LHTKFNGELPVELHLSISAPCSFKYFIIFKFPISHEIDKGVSPLSFFVFTSAPSSTNFLIISSFSFLHALIKSIKSMFLSFYIFSKKKKKKKKKNIKIF